MDCLACREWIFIYFTLLLYAYRKGGFFFSFTSHLYFLRLSFLELALRYFPFVFLFFFCARVWRRGIVMASTFLPGGFFFSFSDQWADPIDCQTTDPRREVCILGKCIKSIMGVDLEFEDLRKHLPCLVGFFMLGARRSSCLFGFAAWRFFFRCFRLDGESALQLHTCRGCGERGVANVLLIQFCCMVNILL